MVGDPKERVHKISCVPLIWELTVAGVLPAQLLHSYKLRPEIVR